MNSAVTEDPALVPFRDQLVGNIAATLPGASALFRASRIDFCCGGEIVLGEAARARGLDVDALEAALLELHSAGAAAPPESTDALVDHILKRYHETHRRELAELVRLARKVEAVHRDHPDAPRGLADELEGLRLELDDHMHVEEEILFPLLLAGGAARSGLPIEQMRREHRQHGDRLARLEELAHEFEVPVDACRSWCALYAGSSKFVEDVREHIHLENNVLFPRFGES